MSVRTTPTTTRAPWLAGIHAATLRCLASPAFVAWLATLRRKGARGLAVVQAASESLSRELVYRFDGADHVIGDFDTCRRRGWAACGDAVAILAAVTVAERMSSSATVLIEAPSAMPSYAHVRLMVRIGDRAAEVFDPFGRWAASRRGSVEFLVAVSDLLSSPQPTLSAPVGVQTLAAVAA
jgi:hypothetical protein